MGNRAAWILLLALAAPQAAPCPASAEKSLPGFHLDEVKVAGLPRLPDGHIPPVPPPTDTGYYSPAGIRLDSSVTVEVDGGGGRVLIELPRTGASAPYRSSLFARFVRGGGSFELSWAAVVCAGGRYLGYKGATLRLPDGEGELLLRDAAYSLGPLKGLVGSTHPWLVKAAGGSEDLDRLCVPGLQERLKALSPRALPRSVPGYDLRLEGGRKLTLSWGGPGY